MKTFSVKTVWLLLAAMTGMAGMVGMASSAWAGTAGQVTHLSGILSAKRADGASRLLAVRSEVEEGDVLTTEKGAYARIKFVDGAEVVLRPSSQFKVGNYRYNAAEPAADSAAMSLLKGGLRAVTGAIGKRNHDAVSVNTPTATIGIRGTHFGALFCSGDCGGIPGISGQPPADGLHVDVADGAIVVSNAAGQQLIGAGQFGFVLNAQTPPAMVSPQQGIQVTMPPAISQNDATGTGIGRGGDAECVAR